MTQSNLKIVLDNGSVFDIGDPNDLGLKLNRIVDDFGDLSKRYGDFSYTVTLPITRNNRAIWEFADVKGRTRIFKAKSFACKVFDGNDLLLQGIIELQSFSNEKYSCVFYSSFTPIVDALSGKKANEVNVFDPVVWQYEKTIVNHIRADYKNSDETTHVFPIIFYQTPFYYGVTPGSGLFDPPDPEYFMATKSNYQSGLSNPVYYSALPPAFFMVRILKAILNDIGWELGGSFVQDDQIKKIIVPYVGSNETYSGAIISGTTNYLNLNRLLPDVDCVTFLTAVINTFNLYFTIDPDGKQFNLETGNVMFGSTAQPYDLTNKIDHDSIVISKIDDEPTITFTDDGNNNFIGGYNRLFDYSQFGRLPKFPSYLLTTNNNYRNYGLGIPNSDYGEGNELRETYKPGTLENLWNKTSGTGKDIRLGFSYANIFEYSMVNRWTINNVEWNDTDTYNDKFEDMITYSIPLISPQTAYDNNGKEFTPSATANYVEGNNPKDQTYSGGLKLYYWYGSAAYNASISGVDYCDYCWFSIATGATGGTAPLTPTFARVRSTIASPWKLMSVAEKNRLLQTITGSTEYDKVGVSGAEAHNLLLTYFTVGKINDPYTTTDYSLTLGENPMFPNLYTKFHEKKFIQMRESYLLDASMRMNAFDFSQMTINRALKYDNQLYRLVAIKNYDPVQRSASITLMKR